VQQITDGDRSSRLANRAAFSESTETGPGKPNKAIAAKTATIAKSANKTKIEVKKPGLV
jgi:hypothetical protein